MTKHYVNAALNSLSRSPAYTLISLLGLAVAFASLLLIGAYVRSELTHDQWVPGYENVYRLGKTATFGGQVLESQSGAAGEALWLKQDIPEVQAIARLRPSERPLPLRSNDVEIFSTVVWADPSIFQVLPFPVMAGSQTSALEDADALVISRALARRLLGNEQVVGKTIEVDGRPMRITAVLDALPGPSHLSIDALVSSNSSHSPLAVTGGGRIGWDAVYTYLRTTPGSMSAVRDALPALIDRHVSAADIRGLEPAVRISSIISYELQPLSGIHMLTQKDVVVPYTTDMLEPGGDTSLLLALSAIAVLILLVATANFVNIMSAKAAQRAVEVGMRKVTGASRLQLVRQFVGESTALAAVGAVVGILAGLLCLPGFGAYLNRDLPPSFLADPLLASALLLAVLLAGLLGGIYPGLVMSSFRPAQILRGALTHTTRAGALRHALVIFQFALLIVLVVAVVVIGRQVSFLLQVNFRVNTDQLLYVHAPCGDAMKDRIAALPGTRGVACAEESFLGLEGASVVPASLPDGTPFRFNVVGVGPGALELLGLKPLAGRFPANLTADSAIPQEGTPTPTGVLVNYAAVRGMRLSSPEAAIGQPMPGYVGAAPPIIGVVDDFPLRSLRDPITPVAFKPAGRPSLILVKLDRASIPQTMRDIEQVWKTSGNTGPFKSQFHEQYVRHLYEDVARMKQLCTVFSIIAALIAALGIYGLSALAVEHGAAGVGVRKAFGANRADILRLLLWQFTAPVVAASILAWPVSLWVMRRWLEGFAYHIELRLWILLVASASAIVVALMAVLGHALQLSRVRPVVALRHR
ncbi:MAG: ABC transporter permease [Steroidobacteraceae bacterium]